MAFPCYHSLMEFNPEDGSARGSFQLLPVGDYDIEVIEAEERTSQKGNQMIAFFITGCLLLVLLSAIYNRGLNI